MTPDQVANIIHEAILVVIVTSLPPVVLGLVVGLVIAIIQAVTQVQEQTLTFVPKMVIVLLAFGILFPWMMRSIVELTVGLWGNLPLYAQ